MHTYQASGRGPANPVLLGFEAAVWNLESWAGPRKCHGIYRTRVIGLALSLPKCGCGVYGFGLGWAGSTLSSSQTVAVHCCDLLKHTDDSARHTHSVHAMTLCVRTVWSATMNKSFWATRANLATSLFLIRCAPHGFEFRIQRVFVPRARAPVTICAGIVRKLGEVYRRTP